jgi:hypothetical protein
MLDTRVAAHLPTSVCFSTRSLALNQMQARVHRVNGAAHAISVSSHTNA